ncbi:MAG: hypothetical protein E6790_02215 [Veillonella sp.]|uniref:hypothetical protein n=1 Tax=Veillonella sp. TaxID=1926307 RepID=UPI002901EAF8|nr:hypothetical protein [Veillonella sp.]MDU1826272.1 hypothetical protein [Veillonella sp.]
MLKVFNKDPHFMRDAVIVDSYEAAWDIICSMQQSLGQGILLVGRQTWKELGLAESFPDFVWEENVKAVYINCDKTLLIPAPSKYNRINVLKLIKFFGIHYSIREIDD